MVQFFFCTIGAGRKTQKGEIISERANLYFSMPQFSQDISICIAIEMKNAGAWEIQGYIS